MKILNVIGGLEEKNHICLLNKKGEEHRTGIDWKKKGHNQLCNREVEVDEDEIGFLLYRRYNHKVSEKTLKEGWTAKHHKSQSKTLCSNLAKAISKSIEQGKVLKVDIGGRE